MRQDINDLLQQKMSRKQFLQYAGSAMLLAVGAGSFLKVLRLGTEKPSTSPAVGYGASTYGGSSLKK